MSAAAPGQGGCGCPERDGKVYHQRGTCTDPVVARLNWYADDEARQAAVIGRWHAERDAKREALRKAWTERVNRVLQMHIGLIDEELCEQAARFLTAENWLIEGKPELEDRHVLLIAKAVGRSMRRQDVRRFLEQLVSNAVERAWQDGLAAASATASRTYPHRDEIIAGLGRVLDEWQGGAQ